MRGAAMCSDMVARFDKRMISSKNKFHDKGGDAA